MEVIAGAADAPTDTNPKAAATETLIVREVWRIFMLIRSEPDPLSTWANLRGQ